MIEHHLDIPTADGAMNSFVVHPDEGGPFPVVLFYMDAPGKREELHDMARRLASVGYFVVLPNLYYRRTRDFRLMERTEAGDGGDVRAAWRRSMPRTTECDTRGDAALRRRAAAGRRRAHRRGRLLHERALRDVGRGGLPGAAALHRVDPRRQHGHRQARFAAPHARRSIRCESYFACAEIDKWAPPADIEKLQAALQAAGTPHRIEWYPGVEHGFVFPQRAGIYNRDAAERHWERLFSLFERTLRSAGCERRR